MLAWLQTAVWIFWPWLSWPQNGTFLSFPCKNFWSKFKITRLSENWYGPLQCDDTQPLFFHLSAELEVLLQTQQSIPQQSLLLPSIMLFLWPFSGNFYFTLTGLRFFFYAMTNETLGIIESTAKTPKDSWLLPSSKAILSLLTVDGNPSAMMVSWAPFGKLPEVV